ncbi:clotting factor G beta subunit-like [Cylas formicarius]|uniref:clotting factor G beta subunit-like n=1 Tax=Cylas formicarius TaxID=197179 RepID=UPI00295860F6|nr:clotting factor G beta subunit-like [Cylas formicarius]
MSTGVIRIKENMLFKIYNTGARFTGRDKYMDFQATILGGQETGVNEYPSMAGLVNLNPFIIICGASIISEFFVLTAGHCVYNRDRNTFSVLVGGHNITSARNGANFRPKGTVSDPVLPGSDIVSAIFRKKVLSGAVTPPPEVGGGSAPGAEIAAAPSADTPSFIPIGAAVP